MNNNKEQKAKVINYYLSKENNTKGKAVILEDGRIEYQIKKQCATGTYTIKATFKEILFLLNGVHIRAILKELKGE